MAAATQVMLFNKPHGTVCRFGQESGRASLADWIDVPAVYPAGRLDRDSEGLVILTDDGALAHRITHPRRKLEKRYLAQVEGVPDERALTALRAGVTLKDGPTRPAGCARIDEPEWLWPRDPPIRERRRIPTDWLELTLVEGRNRQVRRMCAAVGYPVLRLLRVAVGPWQVHDLAPGEWRWAPIPAWLRPGRTNAGTGERPGSRGAKHGNRTHHRR